MRMHQARRCRPVHAAIAGALALSSCVGSAPPQPDRILLQRQPPPVLPDTSGWGVHVLALQRSPNGALWAGTYGHGMYVLPARATEWQHIAAGDTGSISWGFVNSIAFETDTATVWYGTVGNGFGRSTDGGATWRNWTFQQLGPEWQYVVPQGIVVRRDTVYIATADGLRLSGDGGTTWRCVQARGGVSGGAARRDDGCSERIDGLPSKYLLSLDVTAEGVIWVGHLAGVSRSADAGLTWTDVEQPGISGQRVRAIRVAADTNVWVATERAVYVSPARTGGFREALIRIPGYNGLPGAPRSMAASPGDLPPLIATSNGMLAQLGIGEYRLYYLAAAERYRPAADIWALTWWGPPFTPLGGSAAGLNRSLAGELPVPSLYPGTVTSNTEAGRHLWFSRPIADDDGNPHIDATYRYGSTMGGNFQQHQGIEFNNPAGTPVRAIGNGVVVYAGAAEAGALTVAIRHERQWEGQYVFSTYYHNMSLNVSNGQRVQAGDVIARVGNTGRATNDHLHLEIHVAPGTDSAVIVHPDVRFPPHTVNPQLWLEPLPGTGVVAGFVYNDAGEPVAGARIHGLVVAYPSETPFSFAETYRERARGTPAYGEHFAVGDVAAGDYTMGVMIDGQRVWRRVRVVEGQVTWVEFRP
jgi:hypothetical protein